MSDAGEDVRAGVVGVGSMGRHHARVYEELQDVDLVGVYDTDSGRAGEVAAAYGTEALPKGALLELVDVVSIAVPTRHHFEIASDAIDRGVDVLIEKPLVADPERGEQLVERASEAGCTLQVGHVERFNPAVRALAGIVPDLDVIAVTAERLGPPIDRSLTDTAVMDLMIHDLDVVLSLVGSDEPVSVEASGAADGQYATAVIVFESGVVGNLTASRVTQQKVRALSITAAQCRVNVDYLNRSVEIHRHSLPSYIEADGDLRYRHESIVERPTVDNGEPLKRELAAFVDSVRTGDDPIVSGEDGLRALKLACDIERRAFAGKRGITAR